MIPERVHRCRRDGRDLALHLSSNFSTKWRTSSGMSSRLSRTPAPAPETRSAGRRDRSKRPIGHHALQIAIRGCDQADVDPLRSGAAQPLEFALLQRAQQLGLHFQRDVAHLVEKQRAVIR
jgi:hypothetical protein